MPEHASETLRQPLEWLDGCLRSSTADARAAGERGWRDSERNAVLSTYLRSSKAAAAHHETAALYHEWARIIWCALRPCVLLCPAPSRAACIASRPRRAKRYPLYLTAAAATVAAVVQMLYDKPTRIATVGLPIAAGIAFLLLVVASRMSPVQQQLLHAAYAKRFGAVRDAMTRIAVSPPAPIPLPCG